jgi:hypothetical protein
MKITKKKEKMIETQQLLIDLNQLTDGERAEMMKLGLLSENNKLMYC